MTTELVLPTIHVRQKSGAIWGSEWMNFMGIEGGTGSGVQEFTAGNKGDYNRAFYDAWVFRCVMVRGDAITQAPLRVYAPTSKGRKPVDHEAMGVLNQTNPKGWLPGDKLLRATLASLDLHGHFAWQLAFDRGKIPTEVYFVPPGAYEPKASKRDGYFDGIKIRDQGEDRVIPPGQLVYDATMSLVNPIAGTSRIQALRMDLNLRQYGMASNLWFLKNNMRPDWLLTGDFAPTDENTSRIRRLINQWAGGDNRRGPLILGGGNMAAHLLTTDRKDAEWVVQQRISQETIAGGFGVPMPMMNVLENATLANVDAYKLIFWHDTMTPELKDMADSLTRTFLWRWPDALRAGLTLGFDLNAVEGLGEDLNKIWERFMMFMDRVGKQVQDGSMTPNKAREALAAMAEQLGLDSSPWLGPVPQGDDRLVNWNMIPSQQAGMTSVIDAMAARGPNAALVQNIPADGSPPADFESAADEMLQGQMEMEQARARAASKPPPVPGKSAVSLTVKAGLNPVPIRDRRLAPIQQKTVRKLKKYFQGLQGEALRWLRQRSKADGDDWWDDAAAVTGAEEILGETIAASGEAAYGAASEDFGLAVSWDVTNPWLPDYMGRRADRIRGITTTMRERLVASLTVGGQAGEGMPDLSKRVADVFAEAIGSRADTIARTECLPAQTPVDGAVVLAAYRRWYEGPMAEIATETGRRFSATPNHPMFTTRGWVGAGEIAKGDDLIGHAFDKDAGSAGNKDIADPPATRTIGEIFDALATVGIAERRDGTKPDFHGDGRKGNVDVLRAVRPLSEGLFAPLDKPVVEKLLAPADMVRAPLCGSCGQLLSINQPVCVCPITKGYFERTEAALQKLPINAEALGDGRGGLAVAIPVRSRQDVDVLPIVAPAKINQIRLDRVVSVRINHWAGYVFNLSTPYGYFTANGIYTGNTIQAYAGASLHAYREAGIDQVKVYDGTGDPECAATNGDVVSVAVGNELMGLEHPNGTRGVAPVVDLSATMASAVSMRDGVPNALEITTGTVTMTPKAHECHLPKIKSARRPQDFTCQCGKAWMYRPGGSGPARWVLR